jgi:hypothetical protein
MAANNNNSSKTQNASGAKPCQFMKDGVPMYNYGAPGCDP